VSDITRQILLARKGFVGPEIKLRIRLSASITGSSGGYFSAEIIGLSIFITKEGINQKGVGHFFLHHIGTYRRQV
jgi:hypothetical protein